MHAHGSTYTPQLRNLQRLTSRELSFSELHSECDFGPQCEGGTALVENTIAIMEWEGNDI